MCGILGTIGRFDRRVFETSLHRLAHRGPDGFGFWEDDEHKILFGHRRLSIIDLSDLGKQPMIDGDLTIIYNGEIYNYTEVKKNLEGKGHTFRTHSDTEVILKAYRQWGPDCLKQFNGMWSLALWDNTRRKLFLARDRFGVKPLFYAQTKKGFVFGSEMKAIAPLLDEIAISEDFQWCRDNIYEYETTAKSLIKGIRRFPAGHYGYFNPDNNSLDVTPYWNTLDNIVTVDDNYAKQVKHFQELFFDACKIRMRSDVKIGTALSGGLDSSSVAAGMRYSRTKNADKETYTDDWQNAFVATFTGTQLDEREYAASVIDHLGLKGYYCEIDAVKGINTLMEYLWYFEELFLTSPVPMIEIYKKIKAQGVSVSLDGHGADELFSGYGTSVFNAVKDAPFDFRGIREIATTYKNLKETDRTISQVLIDGFAGRKNMIEFYLKKVFRLDEEDDLVKQMGYFNAALYKEFHFYILPTLLRNYDRYSMAAGVEVRMPFMDYRLVSYCFSLPWQSKLRGGFTKAILRDAIQDLLPKDVVRRKSKIGFSTPLTHWLQGPWKKFIQDVAHSDSFKKSSLIDAVQVKKKIDQFYSHQNPSFEAGPDLWRELMPYFWETAFYNKLKE